MKRAVMTIAIGVLTACGGKGASSDAEAPGAAPKSETPWRDKTREEKLEWMALAVLPRMKTLFVEYDAEKYADFDCKTCHGADMELVDYEMPNALFSLSKQDPIEAAREYDAEMTAFMVRTVTPEMARLLDRNVTRAPGGPGFGCLGCHPAE